MPPCHHITASPRHHISQSFALPPATKPVSHLPCPLPPNQSVICLAPYHHVTMSPHHRATASPHHRVSQSFAFPPATKPVSHLPCPLPPNQSVICLTPYHRVTASPCHHITTSPCHCITVSPHHRVSQSFALPPATKPVSHLPCPCHQTSQSFALPPTTTSPHHRVTTSPHHHATASPCHRITVLVSHLPCPLPPSQSVICLTPCHQTSQSFALPPTTASPRHRITTPARHHVTVLVSHLPCPLSPSQSVICLAPCHQTSQSFALPPTTVSPHHRITTSPCHRITASPCHCVSQSFTLPPATKPVSHLPCPLPPNQSVICLAPYHHVTTSPHHRITVPLHHRITMLVSHLPCPLPPSQSVICLAPCHQTSQSFALPPTTASPHHHVTTSPHHHATASPCHHVTVLVSHLPCPLPPSQSVICLAPCHQTSQSFALPPTTTSPHHRVATSLHHHATASPCHRITVLVSHLPCPLPPSQSVICLTPCHQTSQSFALPPTTASPRHRITTPARHHVTVLVSHLPCPLPPNQSVICLAPCHQTSQSFALPPTTVSPHHRITTSPCHRITPSPCHHVSQSFTLPPASKPVSHLPCPLPPNQSVICLAPYHRVTASPHHRVTMSPCHHVSQSFALPPATKPVSHLPCPLPPNQSVICLAPYHRVTASPHHCTTAPPRHRATTSPC